MCRELSPGDWCSRRGGKSKSALALDRGTGGGSRARVGRWGHRNGAKAKQGRRIDLATLREDATVGCRVICRIGLNSLVFMAARYRGGSCAPYPIELLRVP